MTTSALIGLALFAGMIVLVLTGIPIYAAMFFASFIGFEILSGDTMTFMQFMNAPFNYSASYTFAVVPLFTVVGVLASETGIGAGAFECARKWCGKLRGGLLYTVVGANAVFGACSGLSSAGNMVFSKIAYPELKKAHYDPSTSLACITTSGCLSALIPPSIPIILFCLLTDLSIGTAMVYGVSSAILFIAAMIVTLTITIKVKKNTAPEVSEEDRNVTWKEKLATLKLLLPILGLFVLIVGGSFAGWFAATVGGAIALVAVIIYALFIRMPIKKLAKTLWEGSLIFVSIFLVMVAGNMFSRVIALSGLTTQLCELIASLQVPRIVTFSVIILFYVICGCFIDVMTVHIITIPIMYPLLVSLGFSPYSLVIIMLLTVELGNLTPPVGMGVYMVARNVNENPSVIFKGIVPFFIVDLVIIYLIAFFPQLIGWLPNLLAG